MPAPSLSPYRTTGAGRRKRWVPIGAAIALLIVAGVGVSALTGSDTDAETFGSGEVGFAAEDDAGSDVGTDDGVTGVDNDESDDSYDTESYEYDTGTYDSSGGGTEPEPFVPEDTVPSSTSDGYVALPYADGWAIGVENTLNVYFEGINNGDAQLAWMQLSSSRQQQTSLDEFADAVRTSYDSDFAVQEASYTGGRADVWLEFTSTQDPALGPNPGEACTMWSLDYVLLEQADGTFLIDEVAGHGGTNGHVPC